MADKAQLWRLWESRMRSILRIVSALVFMEHGLNKLFDFPPTASHMPYHVMSLVPGLAGLIEVFGGLFLVLGLFTRPLAFLLSGEMAFAYFVSHFPRSFFPMLNGGESAILYCFIFFYLFVAGGGAWSLDRLIRPAAQAGSAN